MFLEENHPTKARRNGLMYAANRAMILVALQVVASGTIMYALTKVQRSEYTDAWLPAALIGLTALYIGWVVNRALTDNA